MAARKKTTRRKRPEPRSRGLTAAETALGERPGEVRTLEESIAKADGSVLAAYRDPLGGRWLVLAAVPLAAVAPTPFQRDLSDAHVKRLESVIDQVGTFLDPVVAVPAAEIEAEVRFWTPNGYHRLSALQRMGARSITILLSPDPALAYRILALNTEKAHSTRERALEAMRMVRSLAEIDATRTESEYALELEDGSLITLGLAYEERPRFAGGAYAAALKASDAFLDLPLEEALTQREKRAERLLCIDERVSELVAMLKERGFDSPYLRNFVVSRLRPFRARGKPAPDAEALLEHMESAAEKFDAGKIKSEQVARTATSSAE